MGHWYTQTTTAAWICVAGESISLCVTVVIVWILRTELYWLSGSIRYIAVVGGVGYVATTGTVVIAVFAVRTPTSTAKIVVLGRTTGTALPTLITGAIVISVERTGGIVGGATAVVTVTVVWTCVVVHSTTVKITGTVVILQ